MKTIMTALTLVGLVVAAPASARICLSVHDIVSTRSEDGKTLLFKMRNGQTLVNHLEGACPGLKFDGFSWTIRGPETVCENEQSLRVLRSGEVCMLGKFDPPKAGRAPG